MPLLPFVLPAKSRALQTWPRHDWLPASTLPPRGFGRLRASFRGGAASVVGPAGSLVLDGSTAAEAPLATSSIMRSPTNMEHSTTEEEWYGVGQVLTDLRMQALKSSPAAASRYAKHTTDTDVWAWKETADWGNRRAIRGYLHREERTNSARGAERIGAGREPRRRPKSAPRKQRVATHSVRPHTASRLRGPRIPTGDAVQAKSDGIDDDGEGSDGMTKDDASAGNISAHMEAAVHCSGADWVYGLASGMGGRGAKTLRSKQHRNRQRQQKYAASTRLSRPRYRISRKRKESFAAVTVRDRLILEKVARKLQTKRYRQKQAADSFISRHHSGTGKVW